VLFYALFYIKGMMVLLFTKWHGLGNDFIIMNSSPYSLPEERRSVFAQRVCDRNKGIGGGGLVFVFQDDHGEFNMRIFNADGSEAEMCGNAIRCVAKYLYTRGLVNESSFSIQTKAGEKIPELILDNGKVKAVRVDMGEPILERDLIPAVAFAGSRVINEEIEIDGEKLKITAVSMGNPHCILFVSDVEQAPVTSLGPRLESSHFFPAKTNVEFVEVLNPGSVRMRVWERGVGETQACGTGACAVAVGGSLSGYLDRHVEVNLPGGRLLVEWEKDNRVYMTGPAEEVFEGRLTPDFLGSIDE